MRLAKEAHSRPGDATARSGRRKAEASTMLVLAAAASLAGCGLVVGSPPPDRMHDSPELVPGPDLLCAGGCGVADGGHPQGLAGRPKLAVDSSGEAAPRRYDLSRGLKELALLQRPDGLWGSRQAWCGAPLPPDLPLTALTLLAFSCAGMSSKHGRHKTSVRSCQQALLQLQCADGLFDCRGQATPGVFTQAVLTWALLDMASFEPPGKAKDAAAAATRGLISLQNENGSWSSRLDSDDILYTAWAALALRQARATEMPEARDSLLRAYQHLLEVLEADGNVAGQRENDYHVQAFNRPPPPRRVQLLTMAALTGIARVRGKACLEIEKVRLGFESIQLDFPISDLSVWEGGLLEWLFADFAFWALNRHPRESVWKWKGGLSDFLGENTGLELEGIACPIPDPPFADPRGECKKLLVLLLALFVRAHPYSDWPDLLARS